VNVLVVTPTAREASALYGMKFVCGAGATAGDRVAGRLAREAVDVVAIVGVCGGLDPSLAPGDLILAASALSPGRAAETADAALFQVVRSRLRAAGRRFVSAPLLSVERPVASAAEKRDLWNAYGAAGVDLETHAIAQAAAARSLPWIGLRAVVDPASASLPQPLRTWHGDMDERAVLLAFARQPSAWAALVRLALQMRRATDALTRSVPLALAAAREWPRAVGTDSAAHAPPPGRRSRARTGRRPRQPSGSRAKGQSPDGA
jgi:hypothetical protein